jgi:nicotinamidase-related amidase
MDVVLLRPKERTSTALVICDLQHDALRSLENKNKVESLLSAIRITVEAARNNNWIVIHSGLKFKSHYDGVDPNHKLYGALRKLNAKLDDEKVHFFMSGWPGCEFMLHVAPEDQTIWRSTSHLPHELVDGLVQQQVTKVFLVGVKASTAVQIACQMIMDRGIDITIIRECVQDDDEIKRQATLSHVLPLFSSVISLEELVDDAGGFDSFSLVSRESFIRLMGKGPTDSANNDQEKDIPVDTSKESSTFYACDCGRRGLGFRYMELLLRRPGWKTYPTQTWYEDFISGEFKCPLGKKICDFCDEPEFSKVSMYLQGREFLDEKDKVIELAGTFMPKTFCIEESQWVGGESPPLDNAPGAQDAPWFIKIADQNLGGDAIDIVKKPSEIMNFVNKNHRYVVQQHVIDPLLTDDGRKCHVKFYVLLICEEDGVTWSLYTYKASLLSISPNTWSADDLSKETQITIHRHHIPPDETIGWKQHWDVVYKKCQAGTAEVIEKAMASGKLKGRRKQKQFEVFSVDWMPDTKGNIWMFEFNMSPAVWIRNKAFDLANDGDERRSSLMKHDEMMLQEALSVVMPDGKGPGQWEHVILNEKSS